MYTTNVTEYDNMTEDYNDTSSINNNCTNKEINIEIINLYLQKPHKESRSYG